MLFVTLKWTESIGRLWHAKGTNGRIAGARSVYPKINGSQGDQAGEKTSSSFNEDNLGTGEQYADLLQDAPLRISL
ncbi:hypothetical protein ANCDUO_15853 [Ancylostoma duodenale]|uniref:Uncharacterized protein n=1 Tax=Ancylostoma duodenale TaxID=51022 RepID=A0A0C2CCE6_9BILA|nr:hypothetical protein ANCDUO_15853 [Ancylostoma duodenale]